MIDANVFLDHKSQSIELIEKYKQGQTREDFLESADLQAEIGKRVTAESQAASRS
jgi:uncharacterized protein with HEPN domain